MKKVINLIDFKKFPLFTRIKREMKIDDNVPVDFKLNWVDDTDIDWDEVLLGGYEIDANDENLYITDKGFYYQGRKVLLYIRDQSYYSYLTNGHSGYKFHLGWCGTLKNMKATNRYEKYVISTKTDGIFKINYVDGNEIKLSTDEELHVCKNCLNLLNWHSYARDGNKRAIYNSFSLKEFFEYHLNDNQNNFPYLPNETDVTAPVNVYPLEWRAISASLRRRNGYRCTKCGRLCPDGRGLHVHHINGLKNDCRSENLEVLCAQCHQKMHPDHKIWK